MSFFITCYIEVVSKCEGTLNFCDAYLIDHLKVACLVAWPWNESEAGGDLVLIETLFSTSFPGSSPSRPLEQERERERETLENAGHVSPRIWEMTKHNIERGAGKSGVMVRICHPLPLCYVLSSPRFWETSDQCFPGSVSLSHSRGREGEDPGNEVVLF